MDTSETACRPAAGCCGHDVKFDGSTPAYRRVLVAQCNALNRSMPFLFEAIDDETLLHYG